MANPPSGNLHKVNSGDTLGKSTLITPRLSIPMPSGAAPVAPSPATGGQGQRTQADADHSNQGRK
jgi:hypothetical protein